MGSLAACLIEPILSSGGLIEPPPGYLPAPGWDDSFAWQVLTTLASERITSSCTFAVSAWGRYRSRSTVEPVAVTLVLVGGAASP